jgi:lipoprotein-anchoring transpeptidase ErfK/SrfK
VKELDTVAKSLPPVQAVVPTAPPANPAILSKVANPADPLKPPVPATAANPTTADAATAAAPHLLTTAPPPGADTTVVDDAPAPSNPENTTEAEATAAPANGTPSGVPSTSGDLQTARLNVPVAPELEKELRPTPPHPALLPGEVLYNQTRDASSLDPLSWSVSVFKKRNQLELYFKGRIFRKYDAVFGRNLDNAAKAYAQDRRTPEGVYTIIEKYRSNRFRWFLRLNYPNLIDRERYEAMVASGIVPVDDSGNVPAIGSAIGIHGTDVPILNQGHINWTTGCISVNNDAIEDLERMLPIGTVVIIKP